MGVGRHGAFHFCNYRTGAVEVKALKLYHLVLCLCEASVQCLNPCYSFASTARGGVSTEIHKAGLVHLVRVLQYHVAATATLRYKITYFYRDQANTGVITATKSGWTKCLSRLLASIFKAVFWPAG